MARPIPNSSFSSTAKIIPPGIRYLSATAIVLFLILLLAAGLAIPFLFESPSMWYKSGIAKTGLRIGKMLGLAAGILILVQLPLAGRLEILDRIFSLPSLIRQHRMHAWAIALMAFSHPVCVLLSDGRFLIPLEMRYWPEWLGVGLLAAIWVQLICSRWRRPLSFAFHIWRPLHRIGGLLIAILLIIHVLTVSESFAGPGVPRLAVLIAAVLFCVLWLWVRSGWLRANRRPYKVSRVAQSGVDCTRVDLSPAHGTPFRYLPGQFAIVSFRSTCISAESHALTLSSTPSRNGMLQFTIRACGDWTRDAGNLQPGDGALVQGPFGRFGHLFTTVNRELIMIAGGIGITPMLSMLRFMADHEDPRPITLIWSNRSEQHVVFAGEMDRLAAKLTGLRLIPIFTRITESNPRSGRLNQTRLESILSGCSRDAAAFVCGPPPMMKQATRDLKALGFSTRSIFTEVFGF